MCSMNSSVTDGGLVVAATHAGHEVMHDLVAIKFDIIKIMG